MHEEGSGSTHYRREWQAKVGEDTGMSRGRAQGFLAVSMRGEILCRLATLLTSGSMW